MRVLPGDGVISTTLVNGQIDLRMDGAVGAYRCSPIGATMWMALRHHDGLIDLAVDSLAREWETDPEKVRVVMDVWSRKLVCEGWLKMAK